MPCSSHPIKTSSTLLQLYLDCTAQRSRLLYLNHKQQKNDAFINQLETLAVAVAHYSFTRLIGVGFPHLLSLVDNVAALSLLYYKNRGAPLLALGRAAAVGGLSAARCCIHIRGPSPWPPARPGSMPAGCEC